MIKAIAFLLLIAFTNLSTAEEDTGGGYDYKAVEKAERDKINQAKKAKAQAEKSAKAKRDKKRIDQIQAQQQKAIAEENEANRIAYLPENMMAVPEYEACINAGKEYKATKTERWIAELKRRKVSFNEQSIKNSNIYIGGYDCDVYAAYGKPMRINRTVNARGTSLQMVYEGAYIYTDNGLITAWSD